MTWITLDELARGPLGRVGWLARVEAGVVEHYRDALGRCWVWQETPDERLLHQLRALGVGLPALVGAPEVAAEDDETPTEALPRPAERQARRDPPAAPRPRTEDLLARVDALWSGSERELERAAGLPKAFLAKAKRGERNGPRSVSSWDRLEAFLDAA